MDKIMIIGFSGCGKSTLARRLGAALGIEPLHFDTIHWLPGWTESSDEYKTERVQKELEKDRWIIEGSYRRILWKERIDAADTIIFLDFNRFLCLYRVIKRRIMYAGKTRPDMGAGCEEKIDFEFLRWVFWDGRKKRKNNLELMERLKNTEGKNAYTFTNPKKLEKFVREIERM